MNTYLSHVLPGSRVSALACFAVFVSTLLATAHAQQTCVKPRPNSRYQLVAGTAILGSEVLDTVTQLIWRRCLNDQQWTPDGSDPEGRNGNCVETSTGLTRSWIAALNYSRTEATATNTAWRLPNRPELQSLVDRSCSIPSMNSTYFPNYIDANGQPLTNTLNLWSQTNFGLNSVAAWAVNFTNGYNFPSPKSASTLRIRLVRDAQP